jgi:hypothetical protein
LLLRNRTRSSDPFKRLHNVERTGAPGEGHVLGRRHPDVAEEQDAVTGPRVRDRGDRLLVEVVREVDTEDLGAEARGSGHSRSSSWPP